MVDNPKLHQQIVNSAITELWIDTAKGLDVEQDKVTQTVETVEQVPIEKPERNPIETQAVSFDQEIARAAKICFKAKGAVFSMFQEARMGRALDGKNALPVVEEISNSVMRNPGALIGLARLKKKDDYTYMHSVAVCALMVALARQLGLSEEETREAGLAGLLHDVGKMAIPLDVLNKPGKLTDEEFRTVMMHPVHGHKMLLEGVGVSQIAIEVCLHHHEKMNGTGYPDKLKAEDITLFSRMGAICDVYDAITSNRPYKQAWDASESIKRMAEWSGDHFDPRIFQAFVKSIGIYPVGTFVKLESGRMGVVVEQSEKSLLAPKVKVFFSTKVGGYIPPQIVDLASPGVKDKILGREDPDKLGLKNVKEMWLGEAAARTV